ncbi:hypothetical protein HYR69_07870 [Candidatus Sumerlaeota bacterium]|nr:hypothetical protein [Candidatus Sumerlaeota bacterium]
MTDEPRKSAEELGLPVGFAPLPYTGFALFCRAVRDFFFLVVIFMFPFKFASILGIKEEYAWARVLEKNAASSVKVNYTYRGKTYEKWIDGHGRIKVRDAVALEFFREPEEANWFGYGGGSGPHVPEARLWTEIAFFVGGLISMGTLCTCYLRNWGIGKPAFATCYAQFIALGLKQWGIDKKYVPIALFLPFVLLFFISMGIREGGKNPIRNADALLKSIQQGDLNRACGYVAADQQFAFLTKARSWKLLDYKIIGQTSEGRVRYKHHSIMDGKDFEGEAEIWNLEYAGVNTVKGDFIPMPPSQIAGESNREREL